MIVLEEFLLCEDAREERSGQLLVIGFMPGGLLPVPSFPHHVEQLSALVVFTSEPGIAEITLQAEVHDPQRNVIQRKPPHVVKRDPASRNLNTVRGIFRGLTLGSPGNYLVLVHAVAAGMSTSFARPWRVVKA